MSPKEKAKELVDKLCVKITPDAMHATDMPFYKSRAKQCALIAVNEIIGSNPYYFYPGRKVMRIEDHSTKEYWLQVKKHIENL